MSSFMFRFTDMKVCVQYGIGGSDERRHSRREDHLSTDTFFPVDEQHAFMLVFVHLTIHVLLITFDNNSFKYQIYQRSNMILSNFPNADQKNIVLISV